MYPFFIESGPKNNPDQRGKITVTKMEANMPIEDSEFKMPTAPRQRRRPQPNQHRNKCAHTTTRLGYFERNFIMTIVRYRFSLVSSISIFARAVWALPGCFSPNACAGEIRFRHHLRA